MDPEKLANQRQFLKHNRITEHIRNKNYFLREKGKQFDASESETISYRERLSKFFYRNHETTISKKPQKKKLAGEKFNN